MTMVHCTEMVVDIFIQSRNISFFARKIVKIRPKKVRDTNKRGEKIVPFSNTYLYNGTRFRDLSFTFVDGFFVVFFSPEKFVVVAVKLRMFQMNWATSIYLGIIF